MRPDRPDRRTLSRLDSGGLIRDARQIAGLSQARLAAQLGTTQSVLSRWERGIDVPRVNTLGRILQACGFEVDLRFRRHDDVDRETIRAQVDRPPAERLSWALERARSDDDQPSDYVVLQNLYALEDEIAARESSDDSPSGSQQTEGGDR